MTSRTERFERKAEPKSSPKAEKEREEEEEAVRFAPEEEAVCMRLLAELNRTPELTGSIGTSLGITGAQGCREREVCRWGICSRY